MLRRVLIVPILISVALTTVGVSLPMAAFAKDGGGGDGGGRGGGDGGRGGSDEGGRGDNGGRGGGDDGSRGGRGGQDDGSRGDRGPDQADEGGHGRGRGRNSDARALPGAGWGGSSPDRARQAVSQGWVLGLSAVLPTVSRAVPGQVLEVDLRQSWTGDWRYEFLVLARDRTYQEIVVDARRNQILQVRRR